VSALSSLTDSSINSIDGRPGLTDFQLSLREMQEAGGGVKVLLIPFAIVAFMLFLLLLGAIGLGISMGVLAVCGRIWRFLMRTDRARSA